jgi:gliding motility-associated lipoprotein GldH
MQHTDDYMYNNIWLKLYTQNPGDSVFNTSIIEVPLAETSGKWLGRGFNHTFIHQMLLTNNGVAKFSKVGTYTIKLEQIMRSNPLLHVQSIGIRIEKNNAK